MTQIEQPLAQGSPDFLARQDELLQHDGPRINVGANERLISVAGGAALALVGLSRRSLPGVLLAAVGGGLMYRGATGHCPVYKALGVDSARREGGAEPEDFFQRGIHVEQAYTINKSP